MKTRTLVIVDGYRKVFKAKEAEIRFVSRTVDNEITWHEGIIKAANAAGEGGFIYSDPRVNFKESGLVFKTRRELI